MWGWLRALVQGLVAPIIQAWQQYEHGRAAQQRDDLARAARLRELVEEELARRQRVSADELRARWAASRPPAPHVGSTDGPHSDL